MSYIGNEPTSVAFLTNTFSGNGSTTAFTLSAAPAGTSSILVAISGVVQDPSTYSVSGTTLTFSPAPPTGTGNISVRFLGIPASGVTTTAYRTVTEFTATSGQTTFSVPSYTPGFIDVYRNGVLLGSADYTASNGLSVVLVNGCTVGDLVEVISFQVSSVLNAIPATAGSVGSSNIANGVTINFADGSASTPSITNDGDTNTGIFFPAADTIAFAEGGTEVARFDSSGNLGIGTSSPQGKLNVSSNAAIGGSNFSQLVVDQSSDGGSAALSLRSLFTNVNNTNKQVANINLGVVTDGGANPSADIRFSTMNSNTLAERMRIDSIGRIGINSAPAAWIGNEQLYVAGSSSLTNQFVGNIAVGSASPSGACGLFLNYTAAAPNNTSNSYLICNDNSGVSKLNIFSNGTVSNRTGTYNSLSDAKLKENIVDATPKLDKLMQVQVRNYNLIGDDLKQIGFVAQELEQVFPGLVDDVPDFDENNEPTGEVTKGVKLTVLIPILVKAIQEQQAIITDLKARIEALENK